MRDRENDPASADPASSRRSFLLLALGVLATGCASSTSTTSLPDPRWPQVPVPEVPNDHSDVITARSPEPGTVLPNGVISRASWSKGSAMPGLMNRMTPVRYLTVHHDGMDAFYDDSQAGSRARLERIRRGHRQRGWGDIGYHYIVDRGGRVWEGRSIAYQGAHVKDHNEGNIGIMCMGNFEVQAPSAAQLEALNRHLGSLASGYRVPVTRVRTHREWASTACPGRQLQGHMNTIRSSRQLG
jgi:hypothetical protein